MTRTDGGGSAGDELREAVEACSASLPGPILHAPKAPCWQRLILAAARDKRVQAMVLEAFMVAWCNNPGDQHAEDIAGDMQSIIGEVERGAVTLHIDQKEGA